MRNNNLDWDEGGDYDYSPNELVEISKNNPRLYRSIVESNLEDNDLVENWEQRNRKRAEKYLNEYKYKIS